MIANVWAQKRHMEKKETFIAAKYVRIKSFSNNWFRLNLLVSVCTWPFSKRKLSLSFEPSFFAIILASASLLCFRNEIYNRLCVLHWDSSARRFLVALLENWCSDKRPPNWWSDKRSPNWRSDMGPPDWCSSMGPSGRPTFAQEASRQMFRFEAFRLMFRQVVLLGWCLDRWHFQADV